MEAAIISNTIDDARSRRADCYRLLSACFCEPEKEMFQEENVLEYLLSLLSSLSPGADDVARRLIASFQASEQADLVVEYAALFVGPFKLKAPPYGSVYLEHSRAVMGDSTMAVLKEYREAGIRFDGEGPPDHIAIELEFISFLIHEELLAENRRDLTSAEKIRSRCDAFICGTLGEWVFKFCSAVKNTSDSSYYRSLAECLERFVQTEMDILHAKV